MYRLTKWQRFWKLDVPSSMIGLVWNMMMSMGGGWFFLTASEAVTVFIKGKGITESLPGMGSYMAAAIAQGSLHRGDDRHRGHGDPGGRHQFLRFPAARRLVGQVPPRELGSDGQAQELRAGHLAAVLGPQAARPRQPPVGRAPGADHPAVRAGRVPASDRSAEAAGGRCHLLVGDLRRSRRRSRSSGSSTSIPTWASLRFPSLIGFGFGDLCQGRRPADNLHAHLGAHRREDRHESETLPIRSTAGAGAGQLPGHPALSLRHADLHRPRDLSRLRQPSC